jgi:predicted nucleotidyltransferase
MKQPALLDSELDLIRSVLGRHPQVRSATLFGSRAKGTHTLRSDVDLVLDGNLALLDAEAIAAELEELPLPYRFDVHALKWIAFTPLREHIERVGILIYAGEDGAACLDGTAVSPQTVSGS